jgi:small-conductance mechanosensitive channel
VTRDLPPEEDQDERPPGQPGGRVKTTSPGALVAFGLVGLVLGWLVRRVSFWLNRPAPSVGLVPILALLLVALILGAVAWVTYRDLHRRDRRLEPQHAVNRLVLAKSCALAGAMVAGGYFGYALSWWHGSEGVATERMVQSLVAGAAGVLIVAGSLFLERACRVRREDDPDLR